MQVSSFPCPYCSTTLRLKERKLLGRQVACPDCGEPLLIVADDRNGNRCLAARKLEPAENGDSSSATPGQETKKPRPGRARKAASVTDANRQPTVEDHLKTASPSRLARWMSRVKSPIGVAWTVAVIAVLLLVLILGPSGSRDSIDPDTAARAETADDQTPVNRKRSKPDVQPELPNPNPAPAVTDADVESRFKHLGQQLTRYLEANGHYPAGAVDAEGLGPQQRLSWLAQLVVELEPNGGVQPLWDRPWRDPLNDRFVRRIIPEFQNPAVNRLVGRNQYPATHFVGMAGVGDDAARLPVDHPRAGMFGIDRRTKLSDVKDGLSNTIMVAGVADNLGSWSSGGSASVRAFTREPYINGPDGFGTGQPHSMLVLMADGSVRIVSKKTSPTVLRRMAAMADGFKLDPTIPGEPGDARPKSFPDPKPAGLPVAGNDQPPNIPVKGVGENPDAPLPPLIFNRPNPKTADPKNPPAPDPVVKTVDVKAALKQPILRFEQTRPVPFRKLLMQVEEMAGVPIRLDDKEFGSAKALLEKPIALKLQNTTVGGILQALLDKAGLRFEIQTDGIQIQPASQN